MNIRRMMVVLGAATVLGVGGCGGDIAQQLVSNEQVRTQVLDAITAHKDLAFQAVDKFMASDSLRVQVVDHVLGNNDAAKQVLVRIGTNPAAMDMALGIAVRDSAMRTHILTLMKGMEMAAEKK
jgi:hypothetical protein